MLFIEGLQDRLNRLVHSFQSATLKDAIDVTLRLDTSPTYPSYKRPFRDSQLPQKINTSQLRDGQSARPPRMDPETQNDLRRKKQCFSCKEPWEPGHHCMGKGKIHLIEVTSELGDEDVLDTDVEDSTEDVEQVQTQLELDTPEPMASAKVAMAILSNNPKFHAFWLKGTLKDK